VGDVSDRPSDLPEYDRPPVDEVAIGVQFSPIVGLMAPHYGLFWTSIRDEYPRVETHPRIPAPIDSLGDPAPPSIQFSFGPDQGRNWYIGASDDMLIQIQDTRFIHNWRKRSNDYPRYEPVKKRFWDSFGKFRELLDAEHIAMPPVQQVEVSYINWITDIEVAKFLRVGDASSISVDGIVSTPLALGWTARFSVEAESVQVGNLYVECQQGIRAEPHGPQHGSQLSLTYRVPEPGGMGDDEIDRHFDRGRETIVRAFTEVTTETAHKLWRRKK
jgi:uncharacterized protein (TIGR04255 family)